MSIRIFKLDSSESVEAIAEGCLARYLKAELIQYYVELIEKVMNFK